jgi:hypothetical protein
MVPNKNTEDTIFPRGMYSSCWVDPTKPNGITLYWLRFIRN